MVGLHAVLPAEGGVEALLASQQVERQAAVGGREGRALDRQGGAVGGAQPGDHQHPDARREAEGGGGRLAGLLLAHLEQRGAGPEAEAAGLVGEAEDAVEGLLERAAADVGPAAVAALEESLLDQRLDGASDGHARQAQGVGQVALGRQRGAGREPPVGDGGGDAGAQLQVGGGRRALVDHQAELLAQSVGAGGHAPLPRRAGSSRSRRPSPNRLNPSEAVRIASPENTDTHGLSSM